MSIGRADKDRMPCGFGSQCADPIVDPSGKFAPRWSHAPFCQRDMQVITDGIKDLPHLYVELYLFLPRTSSRSNQPVVSGTRDPRKVPLKESVDALMREIVLALCSWHEVVNHVDLSKHQRPGAAAQEAAKALATHVGTLARLPDTYVVREFDIVALNGVDACRELMYLRTRARKVLGVENYVETREAPCPACGVHALTRASGESSSHCEECGRRVSEEEYSKWCRELLGIPD